MPPAAEVIAVGMTRSTGVSMNAARTAQRPTYRLICTAAGRRMIVEGFCDCDDVREDEDDNEDNGDCDCVFCREDRDDEDFDNDDFVDDCDDPDCDICN